MRDRTEDFYEWRRLEKWWDRQTAVITRPIHCNCPLERSKQIQEGTERKPDGLVRSR
jgi:hypothetical protein